MSDHDAVLTESKLFFKIKKPNRREIKLWNKADMTSLKRSICEINWPNLFEQKSVTDCCDIFIGQLNRVIASTIPTKTFNLSNKPRWMTQNIIRLSRKKKKYWKIFKNTGRQDAFDIYKDCSKNIKKAIRNAKRSFDLSILAKLICLV